MRVVHLIYSHSIGGAEKYLLDLLPGIKEKGIECSVICVSPSSQIKKLKTFVDVLEGRGIRVMNITAGRRGIVRAAYMVSKYCRQNNIQVIHSHLFNADMIAVLAKKFFNRKLFLLSTKHGYSEKYFVRHCKDMGAKDYTLYFFLSKFICRNMQECFAVSKAMADLYYDLKLVKKRMPYIHHGVTFAEELPEDTPAMENQYPALLIVGRLAEVKGHKYLLNAMPAVIKKYPQVRLEVLGQGEKENEIKVQAVQLGINGNIDFLGFRSDIEKFFLQADVVVQPSLFESFGLVYIEAFAHKKPVIAFSNNSSGEVITHNETGLLAPLFDADALARHILYLLENKSERERLGNNGYKRYTEYFNVERMVQQTVDWYKSLPIK